MRAYEKAYYADKAARQAGQDSPPWAAALVSRVRAAQIRRDRAAERADG